MGLRADRGGCSEPAPETAQPFRAGPEGRLVDLTELAAHGLLPINAVIIYSIYAALFFAALRRSLVLFANLKPDPDGYCGKRRSPAWYKFSRWLHEVVS
jgi:hypothetical protein